MYHERQIHGEGGGKMYLRTEPLDFIVGEKKYVQFEIISTKNEKVVITEATYTIAHDGELFTSGSCEVEENIMQFLAEMNEYGVYDVEVTYKVAPEVRKARCRINVR